MKKIIVSSSIALFIIFMAGGSIHAQQANSPLPMNGSAGDPGGPGMPPPPPQGQNMQSGQQQVPGQGGFRDRIQTDYQDGLQNIQNNRDYRNGLIQGQGQDQGQGSTSPMGPGGMPPMPREGGRMPMMGSTSPWRNGPDGQGQGSSTMPRPFGMGMGMGMNGGMHGFMPPLMKRFASSSPLFGSSTLIQQYTADHQDKQDIRADAFAFIQTNLVSQLTQSLTNLQHISTLISSRISDETQQGVDMTKATTLLATANSDITTASQTIQALASYSPTSDTSDLSASTTVDLSQARTLGNTAIKAVDTSKNALANVVNAISSSTPPSQPPQQPSNQ